jgi:hypothetical protein
MIDPVVCEEASKNNETNVIPIGRFPLAEIDSFIRLIIHTSFLGNLNSHYTTNSKPQNHTSTLPQTNRPPAP